MYYSKLDQRKDGNMATSKEKYESKQFCEEIGIRLWALRTYHEMNQVSFAKALKVKQSAYSKWENGHAFPSEFKVKFICKLYNVDFNYIYGGAYTGIPKTIAVKLHHFTVERSEQIKTLYQMAA